VNRSLEIETSGSARMAPRLHRACGLNTRSYDTVQEPLAVYGREDVRYVHLCELVKEDLNTLQMSWLYLQLEPQIDEHFASIRICR
jgi:hypothetical protein